MAVALLTAACSEQGDSASPSARLEPYASLVSPPSMSAEIVLLESGRACVIDTYWYRVVCSDPGGESFTFGNEGEGPGEFTDPRGILRGPAGTIGVLDRRLDRVSMFSGSGTFLTSTPGIPSFLLASGPSAMGGTMVGSYYRLDLANGSSFVNAEIDRATGRVVWERTFPDEADVVDCSTPTPGSDRSQLGFGYYDGGGGLLFVTCYGEFLVWYADRDAEDPMAIVRSTYMERFTSEEAIANMVQARESNPGGFDPGYTAQDYRARASPWYGSAGVDTGARLWILRLREDDGAYADIYDLASASFTGTAELQGDVSMIDILGNRLIALRRSDGLADDEVDWYELPEN